MIRYAVKRLLMVIPILVGVTLMLFFLLAMIPGDPASTALGAGALPEQIALFKQQNGLDKPLLIQYFNYMAKAVTGNLGVSFHTRQTVNSMIAVRVGNTLFLSLVSMVLTIIVALFMGIGMAVKQNSVFDNSMRVFTIIFTSMPQFWLALMMIMFFSVQLRWLPSAYLFKAPYDWVMPIVVLALNGITVCARTGRSSMLEVINQDYIRTARSKGLRRNYIIRRHALKNALLPMVTIYGRIIGHCFAGSVVLETVFGINGIGTMMIAALRQKDVPAIMGSVIISAMVITVVNLLTDLTYAFIDPRIKSLYTRKMKKPVIENTGAITVEVRAAAAAAPDATDKPVSIDLMKPDDDSLSKPEAGTLNNIPAERSGPDTIREPVKEPVKEPIPGAQTVQTSFFQPLEKNSFGDINEYKEGRKAYKKRSLWADVWKRLRKNKTAVVGMVVFLVILLACLASPLFYGYREHIVAVDILNQMTGPSKEHLLGVDELGRDILARILWGGRTTILLSFCGLGLAFLLGTIFGTAAAYYGGIVDTIIMRIMDIVMSIPSIILMIILATLITPSATSLILVVGFGLIPGQARMMRAQVLQVVDKEFIEAVRIQGGSDVKIILLHILPNAISPIITTVILDIAFAVMVISTLSFLGLGVQPPNPEWGSMLAGGRDYLRWAPHITTFPGVALTITLMALTLVGDGMRDALDPRMKR